MDAIGPCGSKGTYQGTRIPSFKHGADVRALSDNGWTSLHHAARSGHLDVAHLPNYGADVTVLAKKDSTPLHVAAPSGRVEFARLLLEHGVEIVLQGTCGHIIVMHHAVTRGHVGFAVQVPRDHVDVNH
jgi:hypothetical protein